MPQITPRRAFARSPHHLWLAILTLGLGLLSAEPLGLILGATAYLLGWIYLPDTRWFGQWVRRQAELEEQRRAMAQASAFATRRQTLLASLPREARQRYEELSGVCKQIQASALEGDVTSSDTVVRKLEELMWTYLKLLSMEQALTQFLQEESQESLRLRVQEAERELARLQAELEQSAPQLSPSALEARKRLLTSKSERLESLRKRWERVLDAHHHVELVRAEQDRLAEQLKLLRADSIALRNAQALSDRIDLSVGQLEETNKWLAQLAEFREFTEGIPPPGVRVGFGDEQSQTKRRGKAKEGS